MELKTKRVGGVLVFVLVLVVVVETKLLKKSLRFGLFDRARFLLLRHGGGLSVFVEIM